MKIGDVQQATAMSGFAQWALNPGKTMPSIDVRAVGFTTGTPVYNVNPASGFSYNDPDKETLAADFVRSKGRPRSRDGRLPNEKLKNAHAELAVLQELYESGRTQGQSLKMAVTGKEICGFCEKDLPQAAQRAGLKEWTIYKENTGDTSYWKKGMNLFEKLERKQ